DVEPAEVLERLPHHVFDLLGHAHVGGNSDGFPAPLDDFFAGGLEMRPVAAGQDEPRSQPAEAPGKGAAQAGAAAGGDGPTTRADRFTKHLEAGDQRFTIIIAAGVISSLWWSYRRRSGGSSRSGSTPTNRALTSR